MLLLDLLTLLFVVSVYFVVRVLGWICFLKKGTTLTFYLLEQIYLVYIEILRPTLVGTLNKVHQLLASQSCYVTLRDSLKMSYRKYISWRTLYKVAYLLCDRPLLEYHYGFRRMLYLTQYIVSYLIHIFCFGGFFDIVWMLWYKFYLFYGPKYYYYKGLVSSPSRIYYIIIDKLSVISIHNLQTVWRYCARFLTPGYSLFNLFSDFSKKWDLYWIERFSEKQIRSFYFSQYFHNNPTFVNYKRISRLLFTPIPPLIKAHYGFSPNHMWLSTLLASRVVTGVFTWWYVWISPTLLFFLAAWLHSITPMWAVVDSHNLVDHLPFYYSHVVPETPQPLHDPYIRAFRPNFSNSQGDQFVLNAQNFSTKLSSGWKDLMDLDFESSFKHSPVPDPEDTIAGHFSKFTTIDRMLSDSDWERYEDLRDEEDYTGETGLADRELPLVYEFPKMVSPNGDPKAAMGLTIFGASPSIFFPWTDTFWTAVATTPSKSLEFLYTNLSNVGPHRALYDYYPIYSLYSYGALVVYILFYWVVFFTLNSDWYRFVFESSTQQNRYLKSLNVDTLSSLGLPLDKAGTSFNVLNQHHLFDLDGRQNLFQYEDLLGELKHNSTLSFSQKQKLQDSYLSLLEALHSFYHLELKKWEDSEQPIWLFQFKAQQYFEYFVNNPSLTDSQKELFLGVSPYSKKVIGFDGLIKTKTLEMTLETSLTKEEEDLVVDYSTFLYYIFNIQKQVKNHYLNSKDIYSLHSNLHDISLPLDISSTARSKSKQSAYIQSCLFPQDTIWELGIQFDKAEQSSTESLQSDYPVDYYNTYLSELGLDLYTRPLPHELDATEKIASLFKQSDVLDHNFAEDDADFKSKFQVAYAPFRLYEIGIRPSFFGSLTTDTIGSFRHSTDHSLVRAQYPSVVWNETLPPSANRTLQINEFIKLYTYCRSTVLPKYRGGLNGEAWLLLGLYESDPFVQLGFSVKSNQAHKLLKMCRGAAITPLDVLGPSRLLPNTDSLAHLDNEPVDTLSAFDDSHGEIVPISSAIVENSYEDFDETLYFEDEVVLPEYFLPDEIINTSFRDYIKELGLFDEMGGAWLMKYPWKRPDTGWYLTFWGSLYQLLTPLPPNLVTRIFTRFTIPKPEFDAYSELRQGQSFGTKPSKDPKEDANRNFLSELLVGVGFQQEGSFVPHNEHSIADREFHLEPYTSLKEASLKHESKTHGYEFQYEYDPELEFFDEMIDFFPDEDPNDSFDDITYDFDKYGMSWYATRGFLIAWNSFSFVSLLLFFTVYVNLTHFLPVDITLTEIDLFRHIGNFIERVLPYSLEWVEWGSEGVWDNGFYIEPDSQEEEGIIGEPFSFYDYQDLLEEGLLTTEHLEKCFNRIKGAGPEVQKILDSNGLTINDLNRAYNLDWSLYHLFEEDHEDFTIYHPYHEMNPEGEDTSYLQHDRIKTYPTIHMNPAQSELRLNLTVWDSYEDQYHKLRTPLLFYFRPLEVVSYVFSVYYENLLFIVFLIHPSLLKVPYYTVFPLYAALKFGCMALITLFSGSVHYSAVFWLSTISLLDKYYITKQVLTVDLANTFFILFDPFETEARVLYLEPNYRNLSKPSIYETYNNIPQVKLGLRKHPHLDRAIITYDSGDVMFIDRAARRNNLLSNEFIYYFGLNFPWEPYDIYLDSISPYRARYIDPMTRLEVFTITDGTITYSKQPEANFLNKL